MQVEVDLAQGQTEAVRKSLHEAKIKLERQQDQAVRLLWCMSPHWMLMHVHVGLESHGFLVEGTPHHIAQPASLHSRLRWADLRQGWCTARTTTRALMPMLLPAMWCAGPAEEAEGAAGGGDR